MSITEPVLENLAFLSRLLVAPTVMTSWQRPGKIHSPPLHYQRNNHNNTKFDQQFDHLVDGGGIAFS